MFKNKYCLGVAFLNTKSSCIDLNYIVSTYACMHRVVVNFATNFIEAEIFTYIIFVPTRTSFVVIILVFE